MDTPRQGASPDNPLEFRTGTKDRIFAIWADFLGTGGDVLQSAVWTGPPSITASDPQINTTGVLELDGVEYPQNTVATVVVEGFEEGVLIEMQCAIVTTPQAREDIQSLWIKGVKNYTA